MQFTLNEDQIAVRDMARDFAAEKIAPHALRWDEEKHFPVEVMREAATLGIGGIYIRDDVGGSGMTRFDAALIFEALAQGCPTTSAFLSIHNMASWMVDAFGNDTQRRKWLPKLCTMELIASYCLTEPGSGSDAAALRTRAVRDGDHYVLNGTKMFVTNAPVADLFAAYATIDPALGPMGITAFLIERNTPGLTIPRKLEKMGLRTSPMAEVVFEDCRVPVTNRLGREGRGVAVFECSMEWERGCILANCLGVMRRQLEEVIAHAQSRKQFGKAIGKNQSVANRIVDMKVRLDTCRPMVYRLGWMKARGENALMAAAIAKLYVSECYVKSSLDAIQIFGGYGYMKEQQIERDLRDAVASTLYSGTTEIQRNIIAKFLGL
jgi:alkylation response protein AidB-like acyl-CoA dehydrogenase